MDSGGGSSSQLHDLCCPTFAFAYFPSPMFDADYPMQPDPAAVQLIVFDIDGVARGKLISPDKLESGTLGELGFCNVVFGWDMHDAPYDNVLLSGPHTGFADARIRIYESTKRRLSWSQQMDAYIGDFDGSTLAEICPRSLARRVLAKAQQMGFLLSMGFEYEWTQFQAGYAMYGDQVAPEPTTKGMHGYSLLKPGQNSGLPEYLFNSLQQMDLPIEGLHTETGPGVYEAALKPAFGLEAADRAALFKLSTKRISQSYGVTSSFIAKWNAQLPGNGGHFHQSLWDLREERNLFFDPQAQGAMSPTMKHYLAGQLHWMPMLMPMYAPLINSYKRLVPKSWAPTHVSWGVDNRTTALRIAGHRNSNFRIETRLPGADANPYLVLAASVAAGLDGIERKLPLELTATQGEAGAAPGLQSLPSNLAEATALMDRHREELGGLLGATFVDHFIRTRQWEWRLFERSVSNWELNRYVELA